MYRFECKSQNVIRMACYRVQLTRVTRQDVIGISEDAQSEIYNIYLI